MYRRKHIYTCDQCGEVKESPAELGWPHITLQLDDKRIGNFDFCTVGCQDEWLKAHGFEVKE